MILSNLFLRGNFNPFRASALGSWHLDRARLFLHVQISASAVAALFRYVIHKGGFLLGHAVSIRRAFPICVGTDQRLRSIRAANQEHRNRIANPTFAENDVICRMWIPYEASRGDIQDDQPLASKWLCGEGAAYATLT